jgi:hypothetical protein
MSWCLVGSEMCIRDRLTTEQAAYIGVPVSGPYKVDHYRY